MAKIRPEDFVGLWVERLKRSYRSKKEIMREWLVLREFYENRYFSNDYAGDRVSTNFLFSIIRQTMSTLYFQNPTMYFKGQSKLGHEVAPIMEQFTALVRRAIDAESEERTVLRHALLYGTGIMKHGYNAQYAIETPLAEDGLAKKLRKGQGAVFEDADLSQGIFTEHDLRIRGGYPWIKAIHPFDFFMDPEAMKPIEARWYAHRFRRPHADVVRDSRYDLEAREEVQPSGQGGFAMEGLNDFRNDYLMGAGRGGDRAHSDSSIVSLYEISDIENRETIVVADNGSRPLMRVPDPIGLIDSPYELLVFYESETSPWGLSYANQFSGIVEAINKMRSDMLEHLSRHGRTRGIYRKEILSETEARNLAELPEGGLIGVEWDRDQPLSNAIQVLDQETISPDAWRLADLIQSDLDNVSGVNENARGGSSSTETATEASIISQQGGLRIGDMQYQNTRFLRRSTRRLVSIMKKFWPAERLVPIFGADGQIIELANLTQDDVLSDYEVDIEPGSTERIDKNVRTRQIIDGMREFAAFEPFLNRQGAGFNWIELTKVLMKAMQLTQNPERLLVLPEAAPQPQQPPGNVLPFGQTPGAAPVNALGQIPSESEGFEPGRLLSESENI